MFLKDFLVEDPAFGMAMQAPKTLSDPAAEAVLSWQLSNWRNGKLMRAYEENSEIAQEIDRAFAPIRAKLPPVLTLYRGINDIDPEYREPLLTSWTTDRKVAEVFAGRADIRKSGKDIKYVDRRSKVFSLEEIDRAVAQYEEKGFVRVGQMVYKRDRDNPQYYNIFSGTRPTNMQVVTDGDDLRKSLMRDRESALDWNERIENIGMIWERQIPRERVVWIADSAFSKEYIVRRED